ncbi:MAG: hypothetical protein ABSC02_08670 [Acidobacteriota bacterium]|jgi:hypothetical protein
MKEIVARWNRQYFDGELSDECLREIDQIDENDRELVQFIDTWLFYFNKAGSRARDISPLGSRFFARIARSYMPSLWAMIPPVTRPGRLRIMDRVAQDILGFRPHSCINFLDVGSGYPPLPTQETACTFPAWTCVGIDPNFPASILYNREDAAACFNQRDQLVYIQYLKGDLQPGPETVERDKQQFAEHWETLRNDVSMREDLSRCGRLIVDPISHYKGGNLTFTKSTLIDYMPDQTFDFIRCMNVFMYFDRSCTIRNIKKAKSLMGKSGTFTCGNVPEPGCAARYLVYQKNDDDLLPKYFGFDLGKLSQKDGNGWWAFYKNQPEPLFLAKIVKMVADNQELSQRVHDIIDRVESEVGIAHRDSKGYRHETNFIHNTSHNIYLNKVLAEECGNEITAFLKCNGVHTEMAPFDHLVIDLSKTGPEHYEQLFPVL